MVMEALHNICNMCSCDLPDMSCTHPWAAALRLMCTLLSGKSPAQSAHE